MPGPDEPQSTPTGDELLAGILAGDTAAALAAGKVITTTWAARPAATVAGSRLFVTDVGIGGSLWVSDGTVWVPLAPITLVRSGAKVSIPNNTLTTDQVYVTYNLPAGLMGTKGAIQVDELWTCTGSTNQKTCRARLGGAAGAAFITQAIATGTFVTARLTGTIRNRGVANSQIYPPISLAGGPSTGSAAAVNVSAIDTAVATTILLIGGTALAGEVLDLEWHEIRLVP